MAAVYKYLSEEAHAQALIEKGELYLRSLAYFRNYEDELVRGDPDDGKLHYEPEGGLSLTKDTGELIQLPPGSRFRASVQAEDIFVYCLSFERSEALAEKFKSPFCVEIQNADLVAARLRREVKLRSKLDRRVYRGGVQYRPVTTEPGADWPLPERVAFIKPKGWEWQTEYRMVVGRKGVFAFENVSLAIETGAVDTLAEEAGSPLIMKVGDLSRIAQLHRF